MGRLCTATESPGETSFQPRRESISGETLFRDTGKEVKYYKISLSLKLKFLWRPVQPKSVLKPVFNNREPVFTSLLIISIVWFGHCIDQIVIIYSVVAYRSVIGGGAATGSASQPSSSSAQGRGGFPLPRITWVITELHWFLWLLVL